MRRLIAALIVIACAEGQKPATPVEQPAGPLRRLTIVGINDTHGALLAAPTPKFLKGLTNDQVGGADWFAGWMKAVREDARRKGGEVLIVDAGDEFQGTLISNQYRGKSVTDVYNEVGVVASALGNHEFDYGLPALKERMAQAHYPILAANVFLKGTRTRPDWLKPSAIVEVRGVKVGIVGVATEETPLTTNPLNLEGLEFVPGGPEAAREADALRARGATVVIVTAHAGPFPPANEIQHIAEACKGRVDAIVSGHHHTTIGPPPLIVENIPIVQSGAKLQNFSLIELGLDEKGHVRDIAVNDGTVPRPGGPQPILHSKAAQVAGSRRVTVDEAVSWRGIEVKPDERVAKLLRDYQEPTEELARSVIGSSEVDLKKGGADDLLANLCADALRSGAGGGLKADFAFQNSGGLRVPEIPRGPITFNQIFELVPFENEQVVVTLSAKDVRDALEAAPRAGKGPMRVSGLRYTLDWQKYAGLGPDPKALPAGALVTKIADESGQNVCETKSCSARSCEAACSDKTYTLAVTDFLAFGGDGLTVLKDKPRKVGGVLARDMIIAYVKEHQPLTPALLGALDAGKEPRWMQIGSARRAQTGE